MIYGYIMENTVSNDTNRSYKIAQGKLSTEQSG